jgi:hypothetical protein
MLTRRDWLCSCARSAAALTLPALLGTAGAIWPLRAGARDDETLAVERFLYDPRFGAAHDVAQTVARTGVQTSAVADDLMALWYDDLDRRFRQGPMALAGVTLPEALFVLETLALDHQMRVVFRGEHAAAENGRIAHRLRGPAAIVDLGSASWGSDDQMPARQP